MIMLVTPEWTWAPWYPLLQALIVKTELYTEPVYLNPNGTIRVKPSWDTRISILDATHLNGMLPQ